MFYLCQIGSAIHLILLCQFALQPKDQLPLHMASARPSGVATMVSMLLKVSGKEARIIPDKVSRQLTFYR